MSLDSSNSIICWTQPMMKFWSKKPKVAEANLRHPETISMSLSGKTEIYVLTLTYVNDAKL